MNQWVQDLDLVMLIVISKAAAETEFDKHNIYCGSILCPIPLECLEHCPPFPGMTSPLHACFHSHWTWEAAGVVWPWTRQHMPQDEP